ncbi:MAG: quinone-dependent dihydroorotate dehydrogenase [Anaerolineales bacterium]|nr:quinone-dependent dihydroorotate dehydrogenase [Anaerolineales bacterium]
MYSRLRSSLFSFGPERAHALTLLALGLAGKLKLTHWALSKIFKAPDKPVEAFGLKFRNPLGIAAGYDKNGMAIRGLEALGFGHAEIGTVTPRPQLGNPPPRVFRLLEDQAVINRLGFPSRGSEFVQKQLNPYFQARISKKYFGVVPSEKNLTVGMIDKGNLLLGVNIGKNKETPNEKAALDYVSLVDNFAPYADYFAVNISSPNTAGLRDLQEKHALANLLKHIHDQRTLSEKQHEKRLPVLVKLSPDLSEAELNEALEVILNAHMDGIIVTNTTLAREGLTSHHQREAGGLSGKPLAVKSEAVLRQTVQQVNGAVPIVSVGGIMTPDDAKRRLEMGAALIQLYTGLVYRGPGLATEIIRHL